MKSLNKSETLKWMRTIALVLSMFVVGVHSGISRAIMPDLLVRLNTTAAVMSYTWAIGATGGLFVPAIAFAFDKLCGFEELLTGLFLLSGAIFVAVKPITLTIWVHAIYSFLGSMLFFGPLYSVCNSVMSRMWGEKSPRPMQALSLGWPIGAIIGPLIAVSFVSREEEDVMNSTTTPPVSIMESMNMHQDVEYSPPIDTYSREYADDSQIEVACWIASAITVFVAGIHFFLFFVMQGFCGGGVSNKVADNTVKTKEDTIPSGTDCNNVEKSTVKLSDIASNDDTTTVTSSSTEAQQLLTWREIVTPSKWAAGDGKFGAIIAALCALFYTFLLFSAKGVGYYLTLYAVDSGLGFSNAEAAIMQSTVYIFAIVGYLSAMFAAKYISSNSIIFIELHGQLIMSCLMIWIGTQTKIGLWVTASIYTFFLEPSFASGYTWTGLHIILYAFILSSISLVTGITNIPMNALQGWLYTYTVIESIFYTTILWTGINCFLSYFMIYYTWKREPIQAILSRKAENIQCNGAFDDNDKELEMSGEEKGIIDDQSEELGGITTTDKELNNDPIV